MTASRRLIAGLMAALIVLGGIGFVTEVSGTYQVLPFASWSLFSRRPPQDREDFGFRITSLDGASLDPPVYFEASDLPDAASPTAYELIRDIGREIQQGDPARSAAAFNTFAGRYLDGRAAEVEIVRRRYDVLEVRECQCFEKETVIGTYATDGDE